MTSIKLHLLVGLPSDGRNLALLAGFHSQHGECFCTEYSNSKKENRKPDISSTSFMKIKKLTGLRTEPCGTP